MKHTYIYEQNTDRKLYYSQLTMWHMRYSKRYIYGSEWQVLQYINIRHHVILIILIYIFTFWYNLQSRL